MEEQFSPEADDQIPQQKKSQQLLLLLLLLLIVLFAYLYFFTGLIRPRPEVAPPPQPVSQGPIVNQPLPPRTAEPAAPGETAKGPSAGNQGQKAAPAAAGKGGEAQPGANPSEAKGAKASPAAAQQAKGEKGAAPAAQAKGAKAGAPVPAAQAKGGKAEAGAQAKGGKAEAGAQAKGGKPESAGAQAKAGKAPQGKGEAVAKEAKSTPAAGGKVTEAKAKPGAEKAAAQPKKGAVAAKAGAGAYALEIDSDLAESEMPSVVRKLKQAGITNVVKNRGQKGETMHRLFLADFGDHQEALEELERLKLAAPGAFILKENGRYAVYAGSYLREGKAAVEQDRLYAKGVKLILKNATTPVAVVKVRAGSFADKARAEKAAAALKRSGLPARVVKAAK